MVTQQLVENLLKTKMDDIPEEVKLHGKKSLLETQVHELKDIIFPA